MPLHLGTTNRAALVPGPSHACNRVPYIATKVAQVRMFSNIHCVPFLICLLHYTCYIGYAANDDVHEEPPVPATRGACGGLPESMRWEVKTIHEGCPVTGTATAALPMTRRRIARSIARRGVGPWISSD